MALDISEKVNTTIGWVKLLSESNKKLEEKQKTDTRQHEIELTRLRTKCSKLQEEMNDITIQLEEIKNDYEARLKREEKTESKAAKKTTKAPSRRK